MSGSSSIRDLLRVDPDGGAILPGIDPGGTPGVEDRATADAARADLSVRIHGLQERLFVDPLEETVKSLQKEIDNAAFLGLKYVMTFGIDDPAQVDHYLRVDGPGRRLRREKNVQVVMKPHGGSSGASDEIIAAVKK